MASYFLQKNNLLSPWLAELVFFALDLVIVGQIFQLVFFWMGQPVPLQASLVPLQASLLPLQASLNPTPSLLSPTQSLFSPTPTYLYYFVLFLAIG